jgi:hypothetical protein
MPTATDPGPVEWNRDRVRNFTPEFAIGYAQALVALDGEPYDQARFFRELLERGVVREPRATANRDREELYRERWDSYLGKIREFGMGFAVDEQRKGSSSKKPIWHASEIAHGLASGGISYQQFMAIQMTRTQLPRPNLPLQPRAREELARGASVRPLGLLLDVFSGLREADVDPHLSREDFAQLRRLGLRTNAESLVREFVERREHGETSADWRSDSPGDADIWVNEFIATGYIRRLTSTAVEEPWLAANWALWDQARDVDAATPMSRYSADGTGVEDHLVQLGKMPSALQWEALAVPPAVVVFERSGEAQLENNGSAIVGLAGFVGGLGEGAKVILNGQEGARHLMFEVIRPNASVTGSESTYHVSASVRVAAFRPDRQPVIG